MKWEKSGRRVDLGQFEVPTSEGYALEQFDCPIVQLSNGDVTNELCIRPTNA